MEEMMTVRVEKSGAVTTVINDRINARNAGDPETADALTAAFLAFEADPDARVAVFWGAGGAFCYQASQPVHVIVDLQGWF